MSESKELEFKVRYQSFEIIDEETLETTPSKKVGFTISIDRKLDEKKSLLIITVYVQVKETPESKENIYSIKTESIFHLPDLDFKKFPIDIVVDMSKIAYDTTRGIILGNNSDNDLKDLIIPLISPKKLRDNFTIKDENNNSLEKTAKKK